MPIRSHAHCASWLVPWINRVWQSCNLYLILLHAQLSVNWNMMHEYSALSGATTSLPNVHQGSRARSTLLAALTHIFSSCFSCAVLSGGGMPCAHQVSGWCCQVSLKSHTDTDWQTHIWFVRLLFNWEIIWRKYQLWEWVKIGRHLPELGLFAGMNCVIRKIIWGCHRTLRNCYDHFINDIFDSL